MSAETAGKLNGSLRRWSVTAGVSAFIASEHVRRSPYRLYHWLRSIDPVHASPFGLTLLSRHEDIASILRDTRVGSDESKAVIDFDKRAMWIMNLLGGGATQPEDGLYREMTQRLMLFRDPPDHTRLRRLVSRAFTPKRVESLAPKIQQTMDEMLEEPARRGRIELMSEVAYPLPARIICELLGVSKEEEPIVVKAAPALGIGLDPAPFRDPADVLAAEGATKVMVDLLDDLVERRRKSPGDDLLSDLIAAEESGDHLSHDELVATLILLLIAGHETTANLIGNGTLRLLRNPAALRDLRENPDLDQSAVEELLRLDGPIQMVMRIAMEPITIGGKLLPAGRPIVPIIAAANRDPAVFADPTALNLRREPNPHLSFGGGAHFCIGAPLARLEGRIALGTLVRRFPEMSVVGKPSLRRSFTIRGLQSLTLDLS